MYSYPTQHKWNMYYKNNVWRFGFILLLSRVPWDLNLPSGIAVKVQVWTLVYWVILMRSTIKLLEKSDMLVLLWSLVVVLSGACSLLD